MDYEDHISPLELDEAENEVEEDMKLYEALKEVEEHIELDFDDDDNDDLHSEKIEKLTLPLVSKWNLPDDGPPIYGLEVPVMKEDDFIQDLMYRNDIDDDDDPPPHVFDPLPPPPAPCPQCNFLCSLEDVRPLYATTLCIPAADKGVADQEHVV
ncbi:hypothetical protein Tco_0505960 [Tanacetum coccineum]